MRVTPREIRRRPGAELSGSLDPPTRGQANVGVDDGGGACTRRDHVRRSGPRRDLHFDATGAQIGSVLGSATGPPYTETQTGGANSASVQNPQVVTRSLTCSVSTVCFGNVCVNNYNQNTNTNTDFHADVTNTFVASPAIVSGAQASAQTPARVPTPVNTSAPLTG